MTSGPGDEGTILGREDIFFRRAYARGVATLVGRFGTAWIASIEDSVQSALLSALEDWPRRGRPDDPHAWIVRVATHQLLGEWRKESNRKRILERHESEIYDAPSPRDEPRFAGEVDDDMLRMLVIACDAANPHDAALVFSLKTLCGFSTKEIATRLFISEENVQKRLTRARTKLKVLSKEFDNIRVESLAERGPNVRAVLYLMFNEGYLSNRTNEVIRRELCDEALRLTTLLATHQKTDPETFALLALMHFHAARLASRMNSFGDAILLPDQVRDHWDRDHIAWGCAWLERSAMGDTFSRYHAEAAIAAEHALAPTFEETRWGKIIDLYDTLDRLAPSPLVRLHRAVAVAELHGPEVALRALQETDRPPWLLEYHLWDAVLGELYARAGDHERALECTRRALERAPSENDQRLLEKRIECFTRRIGSRNCG